MKQALAILSVIIATTCLASAGKNLSSAQIKHKLLGYWKFSKALCYIAADGKMYVGPRKNQMDADKWDVRDGKFYWNGVQYIIVTLTDSNFVFRENFGQKTTFTLVRSTKEEAGPE
jgi:hypothetical protein